MARDKRNTNSVDFIEVASDGEEGDERNGAMGYQQTLMYGRYSKEMLKLQYYLIRPRR